MTIPQVLDHHTLVGESAAMATVRRFIEKVGKSRVPVLLLGETGTGKEVVARLIHKVDPRGCFVTIDCGSLVSTLMESELFGHIKGAYTGASETRTGLIEVANGGTAFFDEVGDVPRDMQGKLLRVLQEREFRPVGSVQSKTVDIRVIAATHRDLKRATSQGAFREDLFYRLYVTKIRLPSLRERKEDIPLLVAHFLRELRASHDFSPLAMRLLVDYGWPGNVRQLKNVVTSIVTFNSGLFVPPEDVLSALEAEPGLSDTDDRPKAQTDAPLSSPPTAPKLTEITRRAIIDTLKQADWNRRRAAQLLGISRTTLYRRLRQLSD